MGFLMVSYLKSNWLKTGRLGLILGLDKDLYTYHHCIQTGSTEYLASYLLFPEDPVIAHKIAGARSWSFTFDWCEV